MATATASTQANTTGIWKFGTREIVYAAIGAALYGLLSWATNIFPLPAAGNISFRPAVAVLVLFGSAFGPWVGFIAGLLGNTLGDGLSGWGFYWNWSVGNGLIGLIPGLAVGLIRQYNKPRDIAIGVGFGLLGNVVGLLFASLTEIFTSGIDLSTALVGYFTPALIGNGVVTIILLPILFIAYYSVAGRLGR
jgi:energy-coupling factor transport system substrate-specific component